MGMRIVKLGIVLVTSYCNGNWLSDAFDEGVNKFKEAAESLASDTPRRVMDALRSVELAPVKLPTERRSHGITTDTVQEYLQRSLIGTCSGERITNNECFCKDKYTAVDRISDKEKDSAAVVAKAEGMLIVSFRPTSSNRNWLTNINAKLVQLPGASEGVLVHRGFLDYFQSLQPALEEVVLKSLGNRTLHLSGYSLGGAAAIVSINSFTNLLRDRGLGNNVQAFAYASPRVGNPEFSDLIESLNIPVIRYTIHNDVVSQVPPRNLGYTHVGVEFHFNSTSLVPCRLTFDEDPNCAYQSAALNFETHLNPNNQPIPKPIFC